MLSRSNSTVEKCYCRGKPIFVPSSSPISEASEAGRAAPRGVEWMKICADGCIYDGGSSFRMDKEATSTGTSCLPADFKCTRLEDLRTLISDGDGQMEHVCCLDFHLGWNVGT
jgi:hypothetical protein